MPLTPHPLSDAEQTEIEALATAICAQNRRALARAITLVESTRPQDRARADHLLHALAARSAPDAALRIGLTGTPGVGKSSFTERFGMMLIKKGLRVAVLAVDPSSARSGGAILGDKTRMSQLSRAPGAFIRPSPSGQSLGGVARRSREAVQLCAAGGYDVIIIETVGVGQSETLVAQMSDIFLLLMAPAGGDELQGVKRGIMEAADLILVNKADGDLAAAATRTCADYASALRLLRKRPQDPEGFPKARAISALSGLGLEEAWEEIKALHSWRSASGIAAKCRAAQAVSWFEDELRAGLWALLEKTPEIKAQRAALRKAVSTGEMSPHAAAADILAQLGG